MDVIGHDDVGVERAQPVGCGLAQLFCHQFGDVRLPEIGWPGAGRVQKTIPSEERFSGAERFTIEATLRR